MQLFCYIMYQTGIFLLQEMCLQILYIYIFYLTKAKNKNINNFKKLQ